MSVEDAIGEIKKEIIETHNLIIKTDNLIKTLSAEVKQIEKRQEKYERKYIFNSVVAYVIFVVIIFGGLYVAFDAKVGVVRRENEALQQKAQKALQDADSLQNRLAVRAQQEKISEQFLQLKEQGQNYEALKVAVGLDLNLLSPVLSRFVKVEVEQLRQQMATRALEEANQHLQRTNLGRALHVLDQALRINPPAQTLAQLQHQRGNVLARLNKNAAAAEAYLAAAEAYRESSTADNDFYTAAGYLEGTGDVPRALEVYQKLIEAYPSSPYVQAARRRVAKLSGISVPEPEPPRPTPSPTTPAPTTSGTTSGGKPPAPAPAPTPITPEEDVPETEAGD